MERRTDADARNRVSERGASLPEMLVALFVLAVGIAGAASMLAVASRTAEASADRAAMERLALSELEAIRSLDDAVLGIEPTSDGFRPTFDDRATVTESGTNLVAALGEEIVDGLVVTIRRDVTWVDVDDGGIVVVDAYKLITVEVTWTDAAGTHEVVAEGPAAPGVLG